MSGRTLETQAGIYSDPDFIALQRKTGTKDCGDWSNPSPSYHTISDENVTSWTKRKKNVETAVQQDGFLDEKIKYISELPSLKMDSGGKTQSCRLLIALDWNDKKRHISAIYWL